MKDLTHPLIDEVVKEARILYDWFWYNTGLVDHKNIKRYALFTAQQIADNTTGATKIFYQEVIKEIEKL